MSAIPSRKPPASLAYHPLVEDIILLLGMKTEWVRDQVNNRRHFKILPSLAMIRCAVMLLILSQDKSLIKVNKREIILINIVRTVRGLKGCI